MIYAWEFIVLGVGFVVAVAFPVYALKQKKKKTQRSESLK